MCIAALCTIARTWKQPRCPLTGELIKKLWCIYTMEYYSAIKRNEFESVLMRWISLESIIQTEVSQKEKAKYHILTCLVKAIVFPVVMYGCESWTIKKAEQQRINAFEL